MAPVLSQDAILPRQDAPEELTPEYMDLMVGIVTVLSVFCLLLAVYLGTTLITRWIDRGFKYKSDLAAAWRYVEILKAEIEELREVQASCVCQQWGARRNPFMRGPLGHLYSARRGAMDQPDNLSQISPRQQVQSPRVSVFVVGDDELSDNEAANAEYDQSHSVPPPGRAQGEQSTPGRTGNNTAADSEYDQSPFMSPPGRAQVGPSSPYRNEVGNERPGPATNGRGTALSPFTSTPDRSATDSEYDQSPLISPPGPPGPPGRAQTVDGSDVSSWGAVPPTPSRASSSASEPASSYTGNPTTGRTLV